MGRRVQDKGFRVLNSRPYCQDYHYLLLRSGPDGIYAVEVRSGSHIMSAQTSCDLK